MTAPAHLAPRRAPTQARSKERVARILDAAAALLDEAGIEAVTTNAVARRADVPVGTLYQFFPHKDAVLHALATDRIDRLHAALVPLLAQAAAEPSIPRLVQGVLTPLRHAYATIPGLAVLVGSSAGHPQLEAVYAANNRRIAEGVRAIIEHRAPGLAEAEAASVLIVETVDAVLRRWVRARARGEEDAQADEAAMRQLVVMVTAYLERVVRGA